MPTTPTISPYPEKHSAAPKRNFSEISGVGISRVLDPPGGPPSIHDLQTSNRTCLDGERLNHSLGGRSPNEGDSRGDRGVLRSGGDGRAAARPDLSRQRQLRCSVREQGSTHTSIIGASQPQPWAGAGAAANGAPHLVPAHRSTACRAWKLSLTPHVPPSAPAHPLSFPPFLTHPHTHRIECDCSPQAVSAGCARGQDTYQIEGQLPPLLPPLSTCRAWRG